ncbi:uncharacterized protein LOC143003941 [Genypterus blacodes]|uniref:uncharacterized protein LOC143003941 n=1 Tax=Genypterus blacodes TaxID=154954 RepID=UPI003F770C00
MTRETKSQRAPAVGNGEMMREERSPERGGQTCGRTDTISCDLISANDAENIQVGDSESSKSLYCQNNESIQQSERDNAQRHNDSGQANSYSTQQAPTPAATPGTPDWDPSSDISLVTPTDSVLSPMTSSSADGLTPSDSWSGGGGGSSGWRALGNETPHRDSAYFSDSEWEGDGLNRRSGDGVSVSRPGSSRGGDRGTLTGIEERTEVEEEGETGGKSPLRNDTNTLDSRAVTGEMTDIETVMYENAPKNDISNHQDILGNGLQSAQRDSRETKSGVLSGDPHAKDCADLIDKLFSKLDEEPLKGLPNRDGFPIDNHYTDGILSQMTEYHDSDDKNLDLHSKSVAEEESLIKSLSGSQSDDSILRPGNQGNTETHNDLSEQNAQFDNRESRLYKVYGVQTSDDTLCNNTQSIVESSGGQSVDDKASDLTCSSWVEEGADEPERHEEGLYMQHTDQNELGLRNLHYTEDREDTKPEVATDTDKQLAAAELSNATTEKSPQREGESTDGKMASANGVDEDSSEDLTTKNIWDTLEEGEERRDGAVNKEFDCHRYTQRDLHMWPHENDQWASPEKRHKEIDLGSEFLSGFSNKAWEVREQLVVDQEFWETEENNELAGSEPHPAVLEGCEETWNDEMQGHAGHLGVKEKCDSNNIANQQDVPAAEIQQEENVENFKEINTNNFDTELKKEKLDTGVENIEIPEQETSAQGAKHVSSRTAIVREDQIDPVVEEENQNFNKWSQNHVCTLETEELPAEHVSEETDVELESCVSRTLENETSNVSICIPQAPHENLSDLQNVESAVDSETEMGPWLAGPNVEARMSTVNMEEDSRDISLPFNSTSSPGDIGFGMQEETDPSYPQIDNFSSVDFPSPPPSIDLDVQDDKLESLDDSFPSPPPSVTEAEDFISHINLEDFIAGTETEPYISPAHSPAFCEPPLQEVPPAATQSKGISANLNLSSVLITLDSESDLTTNTGNQDHQNDLFQKTPTASPSLPQQPLQALPELLISEWKDLDEEALEDFEKLEKLCCISGDEGDTLGDLFLDNLELLESFKKTPDQKPSSGGDTKIEDTQSSSSDGDKFNLTEGLDGSFDNSDKLAESAPHVGQDSEIKLSPQEETHDMQSHTSEVQDQGSLSKMTTKNGLMMQVCEERLQFSLSENVQTNVLWGSTVKDTVTLRPWGEELRDSQDEPLTVNDGKEYESHEEQEVAPSPQAYNESDETKTEPLTVIEQPEFTAPQPPANQAMKAKLARLSLALPPLALTLPLPTAKGGFGDGGIGGRIGRRRGLSSGSDPDDEEEDEQEDESSRRVIVVTETDVDKRVGLRSLLKSPKEPTDRERDRGRNVSFFDDVTVYLFDQETPTNELGTSAPTSPAPVSVKSTKLDLHGAHIKSKDSKRKEDLSIKPRSPMGTNPVTPSRFTVSPADDSHLV